MFKNYNSKFKIINAYDLNTSTSVVQLLNFQEPEKWLEVLDKKILWRLFGPHEELGNEQRDIIINSGIFFNTLVLHRQKKIFLTFQ